MGYSLTKCCAADAQHPRRRGELATRTLQTNADDLALDHCGRGLVQLAIQGRLRDKLLRDQSRFVSG